MVRVDSREVSPLHAVDGILQHTLWFHTLTAHSCVSKSPRGQVASWFRDLFSSLDLGTMSTLVLYLQLCRRSVFDEALGDR